MRAVRIATWTGALPTSPFVELVLLNDLCSVYRHVCVCLRESLRYKGS